MSRAREPAARWMATPRSGRWMGRVALAAMGVSIALMVLVGAQGPSVAVVRFPPARPWPPWFFNVNSSAVLVSAEVWLAVLLGGGGLAAGLVAVGRGWRPSPRRLIAGSVLAVAALTVIPPVGSADMLLYVVSGRIVVLGHSPYVMTPAQLKASGDPVGAVAVRAYPNDPSRYGPAAAVIEGAAADLAGTSVARTTFWLKVANALAYLGLVLTLDCLTRRNTIRRIRVHLLWSLNPLMLWAAMAGGHNDVIAAAAGVTALLVLSRPAPARALLAGAAAGLAIAVKAPFVLFGTGLAWAARRLPRALAALALGAAAILVPSYLLAGRAAISATLTMGTSAPVGIWSDVARALGGRQAAGGIDALGLIGWAALAAILLWRMPPGPDAFPAVRGALAVTLAFLVVSPQQRPWYDVMIFPLLAVVPASRLDWIIVVRGVAGAVGGLPRLFYPGVHPAWLSAAVRVSSAGIPPLVLVSAGVALLWLCWTGNWKLIEPGVHSREANYYSEYARIDSA